MIYQIPVFGGDPRGGEMEISPNTFTDAQSLIRFYATLFRILLVIYGGGLLVALACILWFLWFDEIPL